MKSILKTNIKIIVLFFALTLVNCEKEDVEQTNSFTELGFTVKEYSFKEANEKSLWQRYYCCSRRDYWFGIARPLYHK